MEFKTNETRLIVVTDEHYELLHAAAEQCGVTAGQLLEGILEEWLKANRPASERAWLDDEERAS